jgi:hypothetical protein
MPPKTCPFGSAKMKRRRDTNALIESRRGALNKFLKSNTSISRNLDELTLVLVEEQTNVDIEEENIDIDMEDNNVSDLEHVFNSCHHNIYIAYWILFTVASAEGSFLKLKLLKNHMRSTMSQERLNDLATICIENKLLDEIDIETIISMTSHLKM